jgi:protein-tyrosine phosphatase
VTEFSILTVCTGNICRSPLAEHLLRAGLQAYPEVTVASSGTEAMVGSPMDARAETYSTQLGGVRQLVDATRSAGSAPPDPHDGARQLTADQVRDADLVLALSRDHRRQIVQLVPRASRYTFTLRELARVLDAATSDDFDAAAELPADDTAGRFTAIVQAAADNRGFVERPDDPTDDDVVDPFRQTDEIYAESVQQLVPAVRSILNALQRAAAVKPL